MRFDQYTDYFAAITAEPDDDALRLEFARFVASSDRDLSRFIELQIARVPRYLTSRNLFDGQIRGEEEQLLLRHRDRWARSIAKYCTNGDPERCTFHRGFVTSISCDPELFLERGDYMFKLAPLRQIKFGPGSDGFSLVELLTSPLLARLEAMTLWGVTRPDLEALAACPHLGRLKNLDLHLHEREPSLKVADFALLATSPAIRRLLLLDDWRYPRSKHWHDTVERALEDTGQNHPISETPIMDWGPMPAAGQALEAEYGYIPWLHPDENAIRSLFAHAAVERGILPAHAPGSPVRYDAAGFPLYGDAAATSVTQ